MDSPVGVGAIPSNDELEFRETTHRDTVTAGRKLQQLSLLLLQEVVTNLPEVSVPKSTHLKVHSSHRHIQLYGSILPASLHSRSPEQCSMPNQLQHFYQMISHFKTKIVKTFSCV